ncbi:TPA: transcriptional regulator [Staphylococcus aureus]|nr:transcriptional regulator [Staphylococcus aureus]
MSADEDGDNRDIEEKRDALKQAIQIIDLAMYELGKYVTEQVYIMMTANDDVEAPSDYVFRAEVSE